MAAKTISKRDKAIQIYLKSIATDKPKTLLDSMLEAGYAETTAKHSAHLLKEHPLYIKWQANQTKNAFSSKEALELKLHTWLEVNIIDFLDDINGCITIKHLKSLSPELTKCIESIKETKFGLEIKLVSKEKAMDMLCKINGLFIAKVEHSGDGGGPIMHYLGSDNLKPEVSKELCGKNRIKGYTNQN